MATDQLAADDLWTRCMRAYHAADPSQLADRRTRWVMDLDRYRQIRAVSEAFSEHKTDPETWVPDPGDLLCAIPIDVREDGGEPHLETPWAADWPAARLDGSTLVMPVGRTVTAEEWNSITWPFCPKCGATLIVGRLEVTTFGQRIAHYLPGEVTCPNECDWRHETEIRSEP